MAPIGMAPLPASTRWTSRGRGMANFALHGPGGRLKFRADARYDSVRFVTPSAITGDRRFVTSNGTIALNNRVFFKTSAAAPELPMAGARVRLHRLTDGY